MRSPWTISSCARWTFGVIPWFFDCCLLSQYRVKCGLFQLSCSLTGILKQALGGLANQRLSEAADDEFKWCERARNGPRTTIRAFK